MKDSSRSKFYELPTDITKVNQSLQNYTINARIGGDMNDVGKFQALAALQSAPCVMYVN